MAEETIQLLFMRLRRWLQYNMIEPADLKIIIEAKNYSVAGKIDMGMRRDLDPFLNQYRPVAHIPEFEGTLAGIPLELYARERIR